jgi:hypothetical protein
MKRRKTVPRKKVTPPRIPRHDLEATSAALHELENPCEPEGLPRDPIEDALVDWAEEDGEADLWLSEHGVRRDEHLEG